MDKSPVTETPDATQHLRILIANERGPRGGSTTSCPESAAGGALVVGSPQEAIGKILFQHEILSATRGFSPSSALGRCRTETSSRRSNS